MFPKRVPTEDRCSASAFEFRDIDQAVPCRIHRPELRYSTIIDAVPNNHPLEVVGGVCETGLNTSRFTGARDDRLAYH